MNEFDVTIHQDQPLLKEEDDLHSHGFIGTLRLLLNYLWSDIQKRQRSFRIGIFSIFLVVAFLSTLLSLVMLGSVVFLKIAENETGESDIRIQPISAANDTRSLDTDDINLDDLTASLRLLDFYEIRDAVENIEEIAGVAPRWILTAELSNPDSDSDVTTSCYVVIADTKQERDIGLGRNFNQRVLGIGESFVSASALRVLGIDTNQGERVELNLDIYESLVTADIIDQNETSKRQAIIDFLDELGIFDDLEDAVYTDEDLDADLGIEIDADFEITITAQEIKDFVYDTLEESSNISLELEVIEAIESPEGKWPNALGNVILIDGNAFIQEIADNLRNQFNSQSGFASFFFDQEDLDELIEDIESIDIWRYSLYVNVVLKDRLNIYTGTVENMYAQIVDVTNKIYTELGADHPSKPSALLAQQMEASQFVKIFLNSLFMSVLTFLTLLSMLLIYSLMLGDVEEKTYEFGMLRALGLQHKTLMGYLLLQALSFSIPGLLFGLYVAFLLNSIGAYIIGNFAGLEVDQNLHPLAILTGCILGLVMPLIAMYLPIKRALSQTLRDSLDLYHRTVSELKVTILKLEKMGLSPPQFVSALLLVVIGFITYYIVPLAFQLRKFEIFLYLLNSVLILMILGLTFLAHLLQRPLEKILARFYVWASCKDRPVSGIVQKNLDGHDRRNWKTSLMFVIALSFVILSGVGFTLQGTVIKKLLLSTLGSDLVIMAPDDDKGGLKEAEIRNWIENVYKENNKGHIDDYTFASYPFENIYDMGQAKISVLSGFPQQETQLIGIERNYLNAIYQEFYIPTESDGSFDFPELSNGEIDLVAGIYDDEGIDNYNGDPDYYKILTGKTERLYLSEQSSSVESIRVIVAEGLRYYMSIDTDTPIRLEVSDDERNEDFVFRGRVRGMATKIPGFFFSGYRQIAFFSTTFISLPQMREMMDFAYQGDWPSEFLEEQWEGTTYDVPKKYLFIKLESGVSQRDREIIANGIRTYFKDNTTILIDVIELGKTADLTIQLMEIFYLIVGIIALVLAFFLLWISFSSNVRENSWEFGVLRAIGLTHNQCTRIYIYEALALCTAAIVLGSIVGILVAVTLTLQFNLFTELPFDMEFPYLMYFTLIGICLITAFVGSYYPLSQMKKYSISVALRGLND